MAEWSCSGLQLRVRRFDSDSGLHFSLNARVAKLVDAQDLIGHSNLAVKSKYAHLQGNTFEAVSRTLRGDKRGDSLATAH